jgi:hypothetical protein
VDFNPALRCDGCRWWRPPTQVDGPPGFGECTMADTDAAPLQTFPPAPVYTLPNFVCSSWAPKD